MPQCGWRSARGQCNAAATGSAHHYCAKHVCDIPGCANGRPSNRTCCGPHTGDTSTGRQQLARSRMVSTSSIGSTRSTDESWGSRDSGPGSRHASLSSLAAISDIPSSSRSSNPFAPDPDSTNPFSNNPFAAAAAAEAYNPFTSAASNPTNPFATLSIATTGTDTTTTNPFAADGANLLSISATNPFLAPPAPTLSSKQPLTPARCPDSKLEKLLRAAGVFNTVWSVQLLLFLLCQSLKELRDCGAFEQTGVVLLGARFSDQVQD
jgi:hypothetical protein